MLLKLTALALTAIILIPSGAHFFELAHKMALDRDDYFTVQGIYAGWAWFAVPIFGAIVAHVALYVRERRRDPSSAGYALIAGSLIVVTLAIFFGFIFPGNQATANWTQMPENWRELRTAWEYGHATNAVILLAAILATGRALIGCQPRPGQG